MTKNSAAQASGCTRVEQYFAIFCLRNVFSKPSNSIKIMNLNNSTFTDDMAVDF